VTNTLEETPVRHVGVIVPSSSRTSEPQFHAFAPQGTTFHTTRGRITGKWSKPVNELIPEIKHAAGMIAEIRPDLIVYNCTSSSMQEGLDGERRIVKAISDETDVPAVSTSALIADAFSTLNCKRTIVISPYADNADIIAYLAEVGVEVVKNIALRIPPQQYPGIPPEEWARIAIENDCEENDSIFLSCGATTQIYSIPMIEKQIGKPVINSNQAVIWGGWRFSGGRPLDAGLSARLGSLFG